MRNNHSARPSNGSFSAAETRIRWGSRLFTHASSEVCTVGARDDLFTKLHEPVYLYCIGIPYGFDMHLFVAGSAAISERLIDDFALTVVRRHIHLSNIFLGVALTLDAHFT